jgi:hypothetical protein
MFAAAVIMLAIAVVDATRPAATVLMSTPDLSDHQSQHTHTYFLPRYFNLGGKATYKPGFEHFQSYTSHIYPTRSSLAFVPSAILRHTTASIHEYHPQPRPRPRRGLRIVQGGRFSSQRGCYVACTLAGGLYAFIHKIPHFASWLSDYFILQTSSDRRSRLCRYRPISALICVEITLIHPSDFVAITEVVPLPPNTQRLYPGVSLSTQKGWHRRSV